MRFYFFILVLLSPFQVATAQAVFKDINISASLDIVTPTSLEESATDDNQSSVRTAELLLYGPIDHLFDAHISIAGHNESGEFNFELHEGYVSSSRWIPQSNFRLGKFFINAGRLNRFHQHEWPFITAPKVHREFFAPGSTTFQAEGAIDTGFEYTWLLPTERFIDVTIGVTNGYCYGHCHKSTSKPRYPTHYIHPTTFIEFGTRRGLLLGMTYMGRIDTSEVETQLYGLEATYKSREGKTLKWLIQSELYFQRQSSPNTDATEKAGFYLVTQYGWTPQWSIGVRWDGFSQTNLKFTSTQGNREDFDYAIVPTLTYAPSEFSKLRLAYSHEVDTTQGSEDIEDRQIQFQVTFNIGAHPTHEF